MEKKPCFAIEYIGEKGRCQKNIIKCEISPTIYTDECQGNKGQWEWNGMEYRIEDFCWKRPTIISMGQHKEKYFTMKIIKH